MDTRRCASKDSGFRRGVVGKENEMGVDWGVQYRLEKRERVPAKTLSPEGGWIVRSHVGWKGE